MAHLQNIFGYTIFFFFFFDLATASFSILPEIKTDKQSVLLSGQNDEKFPPIRTGFELLISGKFIRFGCIELYNNLAFQIHYKV